MPQDNMILQMLQPSEFNHWTPKYFRYIQQSYWYERHLVWNEFYGIDRGAVSEIACQQSEIMTVLFKQQSLDFHFDASQSVVAVCCSKHCDCMSNRVSSFSSPFSPVYLQSVTFSYRCTVYEHLLLESLLSVVSLKEGQSHGTVIRKLWQKDVSHWSDLLMDEEFFSLLELLLV